MPKTGELALKKKKKNPATVIIIYFVGWAVVPVYLEHGYKTVLWSGNRVFVFLLCLLSALI